MARDASALKEALKEDAALRAAVVRLLARDYPKDFLAPVRINGTFDGNRFKGEVGSNKEWQD